MVRSASGRSPLRAIAVSIVVRAVAAGVIAASRATLTQRQSQSFVTHL